MLQVYKTRNNELEKLTQDSIQKGCWINIINPDKDNLNLVHKLIQVPYDFLGNALDKNERPRVETSDNGILMIINIPVMTDKVNYIVLPLSIIITPNYFITICLSKNRIIDKFMDTEYRDFSTSKHINFLLQILLTASLQYSSDLKNISQKIDNIECDLQKSTKNTSLFQLYSLEKSLIYYNTALNANNSVLDRLYHLHTGSNHKNILKFEENDEDYFNDVSIETKQVITEASIYSDILGSMSQVFASIISNNLNIVVKFLTSITILLTIPTIVGSLWGMNIPVPLTSHTYGFIFLVILSFILLLISLILLKKKDMI